MFYERYLILCKSRHINGKELSPSAAAELCGFNRGTVSNWKKKYVDGQDVRPEEDIIGKICAYFGCSKTWLLGIDEDTKKAPTPEGERVLNEEMWQFVDAMQSADEATQTVVRRLLGLP